MIRRVMGACKGAPARGVDEARVAGLCFPLEPMPGRPHAPASQYHDRHHEPLPEGGVAIAVVRPAPGERGLSSGAGRFLFFVP